MSEEENKEGKKEIPFPPRTYAEARAYYAEADLKNSMDTSFVKGENSKSVSIAKMMKADNMPIDLIVKYTGLSIEEIEKL